VREEEQLYRNLTIIYYRSTVRFFSLTDPFVSMTNPGNNINRLMSETLDLGISKRKISSGSSQTPGKGTTIPA